MKIFRKKFFHNSLRILLGILAFTALPVFAQEEETDPVKWTLSRKSQTVKSAVNISFTADLKAKIEKGWHLYALEKIDGGPIPTRITLGENQPFEISEIKSPPPIETPDSAFGVVTKYYENSADFLLTLKSLQEINELPKLQVKVRYQICNDEICLPPKAVLVEEQSPD